MVDLQGNDYLLTDPVVVTCNCNFNEKDNLDSGYLGIAAFF